jgi:uncharacterized protein YdaU (DUF1376 family)
MPIYWGDYTKKTQHLSTLEHGAYLLLIAHYWNTGEPIPNNPDMLRRITRTTTKQWNEIASTITKFFIPEGDFLIHQRVESELQTARGVSTSQSSKAELRWNKHKKQQDDPCRGNAVAMPITVTVTKDTPIAPKGDFNAFYSMYPKKVNKGHAIKAYDKALKKADHETIMAGLKCYIATNPGQYTQNPSTWLNAMGWENQYEAPKTQIKSALL